MKIPNFPVPGTNEFYSSTIARYLARTAGSAARHLRYLGLWSSKPSAVAPHNSIELCRLMPNGHPWANRPEKLILNNSLMPLYLYFAPPARREEILTTCISSNHRSNSTLGLASKASSCLRLPINAKHCYACVLEDIERLGYPLTYRQHQPSFVKICATHKEILRFNCTNCLPSKPSLYWRMAGACNCTAPITPPVLDNPSPSDFCNWLWLSEQVLYILSCDTTQQMHHQAILNSTLRDKGFEWPNGHVNRRKIDADITEIFGTFILEQIGVVASVDGNATARQLSFTQSARTNTANHVPNIAQMLLLARLVAPNLRNLELCSTDIEMTVERPRPTYIPRPRSTSFTREDILAALKKTNFKFSPAAKLLNIETGKLKGEIRHFLIPIPLNNSIIRKHGDSKINEALSMLIAGFDRRSVSKNLNLSISTLESIEIANPDIKANHHLARFSLAQSINREKYSQLVALHPNASVAELRTISRPCVDWIERYDRAWFLEQPRAARKAITPSTNTKKLEIKDRVASELIEKTAREELSKTSRPIKLSKSRLLASANISVESTFNTARFPNAFATSRLYIESKEDFYRRMLRWALLQESDTGNYISQHRLSRMCSIQPFYIKQQKTFIQEVAEELGVLIAPDSILHT